MFRLFVLVSVLACFSLGCDELDLSGQVINLFVEQDETLEEDDPISVRITVNQSIDLSQLEEAVESIPDQGVDITVDSDDNDSDDTEQLDPDPPVSDQYPDAHFVITATSAEVKSYGNPYILITVKNIGNKTGYFVSCDVYAKQGNVITDTATALFADGKNIRSGEKTSADAIFWKIDSHDEYDTLEYELDWSTRR